MSRRVWLRLLAAGVLAAWLCLFLHRDSTEKSMVRALLAQTEGEGWTVGLLYQFPEAAADSSEAEASIRLVTGRGQELADAVAAAEKALPQQADWRLCEYLLAEQDSLRRALPACEELFLRQPYGRLASRVFGLSFSLTALEAQAQETEGLPEALLQCVKNAAPAAPRLYEQSRGILLPVVELSEETARCKPEALIVTAEHQSPLTEQQTGMALLLQGKSRTRTGEHRFRVGEETVRLSRALCGVEQEGDGFLLRVNALSRTALPDGAEAELETLCTDTLRHCWALGLDLSGLGAAQALREGKFSLTTKNACPELRADVKIGRFSLG